MIGLTFNANAVSDDPLSMFRPSGIRLGTPALTTRGLRAEHMAQIADWMKQAIDGNPQNAQGGDKNQQPFKAGREIFGLVVAVWMVGIGRALGDDDHEQRE